MSERMILGFAESSWRRVASEASPAAAAMWADFFFGTAMKLIAEKAGVEAIVEHQILAHIFREAAA